MVATRARLARAVWEPIVEGSRAAAVWDTIAAIADELSARTAPAGELALFWSYLASVRDDDATSERMAAALERFSVELEHGYETPALFGGLAGAGWIAAHLVDDANELLDVIDGRLLEMLVPGRWTGTFDLISGVSGLGVYFLERDSARGLELVVDYLAATAERTSGGATWHTRPELLIRPDRESWPHGCYDCGVAHGVAGPIGVLLRAAAREHAPAGAAQLAEDATRWLLAQRRDGRFPGLVHGEQRSRARTAWCYGAPGIALALGGRTDLLPAPALAPADLDTGALCHGAASLLHVANRMYQATRDVAYREAALGWLERVLAMPRRDDASLLDGSAGIGLVLLATVSELEPAWDRRLLCDPIRAT